jgi:enoyl-[acyl-carrier protein] reductase II
MNRVLAHTGARYPIVQAPMGWIARTQLASAVSRAGGLGIIEISSGETEACQAEINKMKALNGWADWRRQRHLGEGCWSPGRCPGRQV